MSILLNKIGIGTVQFGTDYGISNSNGQTTLEEVEEIIHYAKENNIHYLDTAYAYGNAEEVLGQFELSDFRIISKYIPQDSMQSYDQFEATLNRLNQNSLYGYMAHRPLDLIKNNKKNWKILLNLKSNKRVKKIGGSFNCIEELEQVLEAGIELDVIQVPYNYFDRRFEKSMIVLKSTGCEIHTRSAFLQGLFFCDVETLNPFFEEIKPLLRQIQTCQNLSGQLLKFVLEKNFVDVVNIGVNNLKQLKQNIENIQDVDSTLPQLENRIRTEILTPSKWPIN